jgi:hypothetical protein
MGDTGRAGAKAKRATAVGGMGPPQGAQQGRRCAEEARVADQAVRENDDTSRPGPGLGAPLWHVECAHSALPLLQQLPLLLLAVVVAGGPQLPFVAIWLASGAARRHPARANAS